MRPITLLHALSHVVPWHIHRPVARDVTLLDAEFQLMLRELRCPRSGTLTTRTSGPSAHGTRTGTVRGHRARGVTAQRNTLRAHQGFDSQDKGQQHPRPLHISPIALRKLLDQVLLLAARTEDEMGPVRNERQ